MHAHIRLSPNSKRQQVNSLRLYGTVLNLSQRSFVAYLYRKVILKEDAGIFTLKYKQFEINVN